MMRFLRFFPGLWINLFGLAAITALVMLALVLDRLSGFFQAEWTIWAALLVFAAGFLMLRARLRK